MVLFYYRLNNRGKWKVENWDCGVRVEWEGVCWVMGEGWVCEYVGVLSCIYIKFVF